MRTYPTALNRTLLIVIGCVLLGGGLWALWPWLQATFGWSAPAGAAMVLAAPHSPVAPGAAGVLDQPWLPAALIAVGAIVLLLGLAWLGRQVPRSHRADTLRFTADPGSGSTTLDPKVLEAAAANAAAALPQVAAAKAVLRGSADAPDLMLQVHTEPSTNLPDLTATLTAGVAADVVHCLGRPLRKLSIEYSVATGS